MESVRVEATARAVGQPIVYGLLGVPAGIALAFLTAELLLPIVVVLVAIAYWPLRDSRPQLCALMVGVGMSVSVTAGLFVYWSLTGPATLAAIIWESVVVACGLGLVLAASLLQRGGP